MEDYNKEDEEFSSSEINQENFSDNKQNLSKNQKVALGVLSLSAVLIISMWVVQLKRNITDPLSYNLNSTNSEKTSTCQGADCPENSQEVLSVKDTDKDGLSDWDELNNYQTSPYLEDSDSDGLMDKEEIEKSTDPNCPVGRVCSSTVESDNTATTNDGTDSDLNLEATAGETGAESDLQKILEGKSDAASLRKALLEAGMDEETLNQISDEALAESYKEILESQ